MPTLSGSHSQEQTAAVFETLKTYTRLGRATLYSTLPTYGMVVEDQFLSELRAEYFARFSTIRTEGSFLFSAFSFSMCPESSHLKRRGPWQIFGDIDLMKCSNVLEISNLYKVHWAQPRATVQRMQGYAICYLVVKDVVRF